MATNAEIIRRLTFYTYFLVLLTDNKGNIINPDKRK